MPVLILIFLIVFSSQSRAEFGGLHVMPLGEREALMANTGVALRNSSGAVYYNPAGLVGVEHRRFTLASSYGVMDWKVDSDLPLNVRDTSTTPSLLVSARRLGCERRQRRGVLRIGC